MSARVLPFRPAARSPRFSAAEPPVYREDAPRPEAPAPSTPAAPESVAPYSVRRYAAIGGHYLIVGHDGRGEPMMEVRVPTGSFSYALIETIRQWCQENDPRRLTIEP